MVIELKPEVGDLHFTFLLWMSYIYHIIMYTDYWNIA